MAIEPFQIAVFFDEPPPSVERGALVRLARRALRGHPSVDVGVAVEANLMACDTLDARSGALVVVAGPHGALSERARALLVDGMEAGIAAAITDGSGSYGCHDAGLSTDLHAGDGILREAVERADQRAGQAKGGFDVQAKALALASVVAVLLAAVPVSMPTALAAVPWLRVDSSVLVIVELLVLLTALASSAWPGRQRTRERWVGQRCVAELLRHELPLFVAGLGPYGVEVAQTRDSSREGRCVTLRQRLEELATVAHRAEETAVELALAFDLRQDGHKHLLDGGRLLTIWYERRRLGPQRSYFNAQARRRTKIAELWVRIARLSIVAAVGGVLAHTFVAAGLVSELGKTLSIVGPTVAASAAMVTTLRQDATDARRFRVVARVLGSLRDAVDHPQLDVATWVAHVESLLVSEHLAWRANALSHRLPPLLGQHES